MKKRFLVFGKERYMKYMREFALKNCTPTYRKEVLKRQKKGYKNKLDRYVYLEVKKEIKK